MLIYLPEISSRILTYLVGFSFSFVIIPYPFKLRNLNHNLIEDLPMSDLNRTILIQNRIRIR